MNFLTHIAKSLPLVFIEDDLSKNLYKQLINFNHTTYGVGIGYTPEQFKEFFVLFSKNKEFSVDMKTVEIKNEDFKVSMTLNTFIVLHKGNIIGVFGYCETTKLTVVNFINSPENEVFSKNLREIEISPSFPKILKDFSIEESSLKVTICEFLVSLYANQPKEKKADTYTLGEFSNPSFNETEHEQKDYTFVTLQRTFNKSPELINNSSVVFNEKIFLASGYYFKNDETEFGYFNLVNNSQVTFTPLFSKQEIMVVP